MRVSFLLLDGRIMGSTCGMMFSEHDTATLPDSTDAMVADNHGEPTIHADAARNTPTKGCLRIVCIHPKTAELAAIPYALSRGSISS